ncbi:DUF6193 family natural product biosynthesis protein [Flavihumibacter petaseus]|uniref:Uncharacterized protein n=1 Tax=Flavihumibacter petaseus NBRC 106054 TaxID=1220578 RepID=A0A0E9MUH7_9BACT|nr:DUF6193 family natural product biosynthesis protein [Flavihumibacter petaseus]GAO41392.1 hypothetical protein FPE01S_01_04040 [Flavihumibacter petaseus NBRC 106054]
MSGLFHNIKSLFSRKTIYPEIIRAGGLANAIDLELKTINSSLRVRGDDSFDKLPFSFAMVEHGNKFSQIYMAAKEKLYLPDFWRDGVCLAHGKTNSLTELAKVLDYWLIQNVSTKALSEKYNFVCPSAKASAFDENKEIEFTWELLKNDDDSLGLKEFIGVASQDNTLNKLFPFTSLYTMCFSRCTGFPYDTNNLPNVTLLEYAHFILPKNEAEYSKIQHTKATGDSQIYVVTLNMNKYLGKGNASEALQLVLENLPNNIQPARKGTAED